MFHIVCRTLWSNQEITNDVVTSVKQKRRIVTYAKRIDAEDAKNYLTRVAKRGKLADNIISMSFLVMPGNGELKGIQNDET